MGAPAEPFYIQWHLTTRCNLACRHCYQEQALPDLSFAELQRVLAAVTTFRESMPGRRFRLQFTGGEPLLSPHLLPLLDLAAEAGFATRVMTNGTLVDDARAAALATHGRPIVQVSIDGGPATHDALRGEGAFAKAIAGADRLREQGLQVTFAMTLGRRTAADIPTVVALGREHADRVGFHRLVPCGRGRALAAELLSATELKAAFAGILEARQASPGLEMPLRDPLWRPFFACLGGEDRIAGCSIGYHGLCIDARADVYPCRRLPVRLGNALQDPLADLWQAPVLEALRDRSRLKGRCGRCPLQWQCGGCRAIPFALSGDMLAEDPQCFYAPTLRERLARRLYRAAESWRIPSGDGG